MNIRTATIEVRKSNEEVLNFYTAIGYEDGEVIILGKWLEDKTNG